MSSKCQSAVNTEWTIREPLSCKVFVIQKVTWANKPQEKLNPPQEQIPLPLFKEIRRLCGLFCFFGGGGGYDLICWILWSVNSLRVFNFFYFVWMRSKLHWVVRGGGGGGGSSVRGGWTHLQRHYHHEEAGRGEAIDCVTFPEARGCEGSLCGSGSRWRTQALVHEKTGLYKAAEAEGGGGGGGATNPSFMSCRLSLPLHVLLSPGSPTSLLLTLLRLLSQLSLFFFLYWVTPTIFYPLL